MTKTEEIYMLSILHTQNHAHRPIRMHTCLREIQAYILRTGARLTTRHLFIASDLKSQFWCFNSSVSFSILLFCKTACK